MNKKIILVLLALLLFIFNASVINASDSKDSYNENECKRQITDVKKDLIAQILIVT